MGAAMVVMGVFVIGFAISLAGYYAHSVLESCPPGFDSRATLWSAALFAAVLFAVSGPVLLARAMAVRASPAVPWWRLGLGYGLVIAWAGLIGFAATGLGAGIAVG